MPAPTRNRDLTAITDELRTAIEGEASNVITVGSLLIEARAHLNRGKWLPWLGVNFAMSTRTAENYMHAGRLAAKFETVSKLKLKPCALYLLGKHLAAESGPSGRFDERAIEAVFQAAESEWISAECKMKIAGLTVSRSKPGLETPKASVRSKMQTRPSLRQPDLHPVPIATSGNDDILFDSSVVTLDAIRAKRSGCLVATQLTPDCIRSVVEFLGEVADAIDDRQKQSGQ
jgi:hypothetical protein